MQVMATMLQLLQTMERREAQREDWHREMRRETVEGNQRRQRNQAERRGTLTEFLDMRPPHFKGETDPDKAEGWIRELEKIFRVLHCTPQQRVEFATYMLTDRASRWWEAMMLMNPRWEEMEWDWFLELFNEEYFPQSIRQQRIWKF